MQVTPGLLCSPKSVLMHIQTIGSASTRYQQYVQPMSDIHDLGQKVTSSQLAWVSLIVDAQKAALDLFMTFLTAGLRGGGLPQLFNASARYAHDEFANWCAPS